MRPGRIGAAMFALGAISLVAYRMIGARVDENGVLREPFFLIPVGLGLAFFGLVLFVSGFFGRGRRRHAKAERGAAAPRSSSSGHSRQSE